MHQSQHVARPSRRIDPDEITLLRKAQVARQLGVSICTINRWLKANQFVKPVYLQPGSPARWRASDIAAFIEKRRASRRPRPKPRGMLRPNNQAIGKGA